MLNEEIQLKIEELINSSKVFLFMKGTPLTPACGFSNNVIDILTGQGIEFKSFNILEDDVLRQAVKEYSNWPTYPQLYIDGKLIGGNDIVSEIAESGELKKLIQS